MNSKELIDKLPLNYQDDAHVRLLQHAELAKHLLDDQTFNADDAGLDHVTIYVGHQQVTIGLWHIEAMGFISQFVDDIKELATDELLTVLDNAQEASK